MLNVSKDVGQNLAGVEFVGEAVDHRHSGMGGKSFNLLLTISANHHQVDHATDDARAVFNGFSAP